MNALHLNTDPEVSQLLLRVYRLLAGYQSHDTAVRTVWLHLLLGRQLRKSDMHLFYLAVFLMTSSRTQSAPETVVMIQPKTCTFKSQLISEGKFRRFIVLPSGQSRLPRLQLTKTQYDAERNQTLSLPAQKSFAKGLAFARFAFLAL